MTSRRPARFRRGGVLLAALLLALPGRAGGVEKGGWQPAAAALARSSPAAVAVVVDIASGRLLAAVRREQAARTLAAPGSTLKPLLLYGMLARGWWQPERRVLCDRRLQVGGRRLACTHPPLPPFDAREALAWSCNTYFAQLAAAVPPPALRGLLEPSGLLAETGLVSGGELRARFAAPRTTAQAQLLALGSAGIAVSPLELAMAYRWLALEMAAHGGRAAPTVLGGLADSSTYGMASAVRGSGVPVAGKTGTATSGEELDIPRGQAHGWFAALAPADAPRVVLVVLLPGGRGMDAAHAAAALLANSPLRKPA